MADKLLMPFMKWAGGKRQLIPEIRRRLPANELITTYYEPFVGGGALLFYLQARRAVINDVNTELVNLYRVVRDNVEALIEDLRKHKNQASYFYQIRRLDRNPEVFRRLTDIERASRVLYLNKTCFNGLYRVNKAGQFNAPFGRYENPNIVNEDTLRAASRYFRRINIGIRCGDFEDGVKWARPGAFVYLDPPYDPVSNTANFTDYAEGGFNKKEQIRLKKLCDRLDARGIKFLLSNSSTEFIHRLYGGYNISVIQAKRVINSDANNRGETDEVLVSNYG